jgi:DUF917 family protein
MKTLDESHGDRIQRILREANKCLTAEEITTKLNDEVGGYSFTSPFVESLLPKLPHVYKTEDKFCLNNK